MREFGLALAVLLFCFDQRGDVLSRRDEMSRRSFVVFQRADGHLLMIETAILGFIAEQKPVDVAVLDGCP